LEVLLGALGVIEENKKPLWWQGLGVYDFNSHSIYI